MGGWLCPGPSDRAWSEMWLLILYWVWWSGCGWLIYILAGSAEWACGDWREACDKYYAFLWRIKWWDNEHLVMWKSVFFPEPSKTAPLCSSVHISRLRLNIWTWCVNYFCFHNFVFLIGRHSETINPFHYEPIWVQLKTQFAIPPSLVSGCDHCSGSDTPRPVCACCSPLCSALNHLKQKQAVTGS